MCALCEALGRLLSPLLFYRVLGARERCRHAQSSAEKEGKIVSVKEIEREREREREGRWREWTRDFVSQMADEDVQVHLAACFSRPVGS